MWRRVLFVLLLASCDDQTDEETAPASSEPAAVGSAAPPGGFLLPPERIPVSNPLELPLPDGFVQPAEEARVFAVPQRMLEGAKVGTAMILQAATAEGRDGDNLIVRIGHGEPYVIHPAYVVVPRPGRVQNGTLIIASYREELHQAVVKGLALDRITVMFTDLGFKAPEQKLDPKRVGVLAAGLQPGAYAAHVAEHEYRHVLLVSSFGAGDKKRWLVLHHTGETALVEEDTLKALPVPRFSPKVGATVLAAWRGTMVRAQLVDFERPALYSVIRPRAGSPFWVGPGMIMPTE